MSQDTFATGSKSSAHTRREAPGSPGGPINVFQSGDRSIFLLRELGAVEEAILYGYNANFSNRGASFSLIEDWFVYTDDLLYVLEDHVRKDASNDVSRALVRSLRRAFVDFESIIKLVHDMVPHDPVLLAHIEKMKENVQKPVSSADASVA